MEKPLNGMTKIEKKNAQFSLKTQQKESHNRGTDDVQQLIAFVKFLARRAAEEDFRLYTDSLASPDQENGGN